MEIGVAFTGKFGPKISILSILNYQNYEESFNELKNIVILKRKEYNLQIQPH